MLELSAWFVLCEPAGPSIFNNGETVVWKVYSYGVCLFIIASIWSRRQLYNFADEPAPFIFAFKLNVYELANADWLSPRLVFARPEKEKLVLWPRFIEVIFLVSGLQKVGELSEQIRVV